MNEARNYAKTHLFYLILIAAIAIFVHSWLGEHDARLLAQQQEKISEEHSKQLVADVQQRDETISQLKADQQQLQQRSDVQVAALRKQYDSIKTRLDALSAINAAAPEAHAVATPTDSSTVILDPIPIAQRLKQCEIDAVKLDTCQQTLANDDQIIKQQEEQKKDKDGQIADQQKTIKALKKPQGFWKRVGNGTKLVGVGALIGAIAVLIR